MSSKDAHLYRPATTTKSKPKSSNPHDSTFSSAFSSLLASKPNHERPRSRPTTTKSSFLSNPNRGSNKRAAADMLASSATGTAHTTNSEKLDESEWKRAKRTMDEKARLYAALKRGDVEDRDERYGVDFDKKWADAEAKGNDSEQDESDDGAESGDDEVMDYVDDMGRSRTGTRREVQALERQRARQQRAQEAGVADSVRPAAPSNIIYGDSVQSPAFDPDAAAMAALAGKRDRPETPPPDTHYDASAEVRTKGTGFYQFSKDEKEREEQMQELEQRRQETERVRGEKADERTRAREKKQRELEERRRIIAEKKGKVMADRFLNGLGAEIAGSGAGWVKGGDEKNEEVAQDTGEKSNDA